MRPSTRSATGTRADQASASPWPSDQPVRTFSRKTADQSLWPSSGARQACSTHAPAWMDELSPFAHLAAVPHAPPDWGASAAMTTVGVAFAIIGVGGYQHRDLAV
jgi:hypothetical protein